MKKWLRHLRGAIGVGVTWGIVWGAVGGVLEAIFGLPPGGSGVGIVLREFARGFGAWATFGFLGSGVFSVALGLAGRRRSFAEMSVWRFALWGGLAGLTVGMVLYAPFVLTSSARFTLLEAVLRAALPMGMMAGIGAGSAAGSLVLARRADDRELLDASDEVAAIGLTDQEAKELLG